MKWDRDESQSPSTQADPVDPVQIGHLLDQVRQLQLIMVAISTGDSSFGGASLGDRVYSDDLESGYKALYVAVFVEIERLQERGIAIENPNQFKTISDWRLYWKSHLPTYQSRRQFVGKLYQELCNRLVDALNRHNAEQSSPEIFGRDLARRFAVANLQTAPLPSPPSITDSLARFRQRFPDPSKVAFIMMRFSSSAFHNQITQAIKQTLADHGIIGLRADDRQFHDDLLPNIETYIHGCGFGIAVFERIEMDEFNPNVSLEVGYMLGLGKPVCLLKDKTLRVMQADLVGKLYRVFDVQDVQASIRRELSNWLNDKGLDPGHGSHSP